MGTMLISLGLASYKPPSPAQEAHREKLKCSNEKKADHTLQRLKNALQGRIMSTRDIAHLMKIKRATAARYLAGKQDEGIVEVIGKTIHAGDRCTQYVWRLK